MSETIKQAIRRAKKVMAYLSDDYSDFIAPEVVPISKATARWLVDRAPIGAKPTAYWEGDKLYLMPQAREDRIQEDDE